MMNDELKIKCLPFIIHHSSFLIHTLKDSPIRPDAHRKHPHVKVGKADDEKAAPREKHMPFVERTAGIVSRALQRFIRQLVAASADQMAQTVTAERVAREKENVGAQDDRAESDAEAVREPETFPRVVRQKN